MPKTKEQLARHKILKEERERKGLRGNWTPWTKLKADVFVSMLTSLLKDVGYGVGMTGSLLLDTASSNDLDIIIYPYSTAEQSQKLLVQALTLAGLKLRFNKRRTWMYWASKVESYDQKHVEIWDFNNHKVDIFFLS